ncbi:MAG: DUF4126 domain-containing protein [Syntrophaceae bacterium]|nr:DUF4126 domain-containing protein [Syntrophaceae bacterium]
MKRSLLAFALCAALLVHAAGLASCSRTADPPPGAPPSGTGPAVQNGAAKQPVPQLKLYLLSAVSALSPGIALLKVAYDFKDDRTLNGGNNWLGTYLWVFWIIAFIGFTLDKIPGVAHIHHFFEYGVIWFLAFIASTFLNADFATLYGILTGSAAQALRQGLRGSVDAGSGGATTPLLSTIEDIVTYIAVSWLL